MKPLKTVCPLLGMVLLCMALSECRNGSTATRPEIEVDTLINLGKFPISRDTTFNVACKNAGTTPIRIEGIGTSCGCLSVQSFHPSRLAPGDTAWVCFKIHSILPGHFEQEAHLKVEGHDLPVNIAVRGFGQNQ